MTAVSIRPVRAAKPLARASRLSRWTVIRIASKHTDLSIGRPQAGCTKHEHRYAGPGWPR
jgi:hypothetical protein